MFVDDRILNHSLSGSTCSIPSRFVAATITSALFFLACGTCGLVLAENKVQLGEASLTSGI